MIEDYDGDEKRECARERNMNKSITGGIVARETIVKQRERERERERVAQ